MRRLQLFALLLLVTSGYAHAASVAFVNVQVISMASQGVTADRTVIVTDGRIAAIGNVRDTVIPDDAIIVDGTDRYLMPGLSEMHGHVPGADSASLDRVLQLYVVNGITIVRGMLGQPSHLALRDQILADELIGPRLITSGPSLNGNSVSGAADASSQVRGQHAAGYDFLKIHPGLTLDEFDAIANTANELGMPFAGHVPEEVGVRHALDMGIATIDHLDGYMQALLLPNDDPSGGFGGFFGVFLANQAEAAKIAPIAAATHEAGVWNVPTQSLFENVTSSVDPASMSDWPEMKYMPRGTVAQWVRSKENLRGDASYDEEVARRAIELRRSLILELQRAGAGLLLGSDSPQIFNVPGFAVHRELELLVAAGLTPYEALRTGTVNPARFFSLDAELGTVEVGKTADLLMLDANPLEDIRNSRRVHGVMLRGRWLSQQDISRILTRLEQSAQD